MIHEFWKIKVLTFFPYWLVFFGKNKLYIAVDRVFRTSINHETLTTRWFYFWLLTLTPAIAWDVIFLYGYDLVYPVYLLHILCSFFAFISKSSDYFRDCSILCLFSDIFRYSSTLASWIFCHWIIDHFVMFENTQL